MLVSPIDVSVVEPDRVVVRLTSERIIFAVVELRPAGSDQARSQVLRPGETAEFAVWRADIFQPLAFDWRVSAVRRDAGGRTLPIETGRLGARGATASSKSHHRAAARPNWRSRLC